MFNYNLADLKANLILEKIDSLNISNDGKILVINRVIDFLNRV